MRSEKDDQTVVAMSFWLAGGEWIRTGNVSGTRVVATLPTLSYVAMSKRKVSQRSTTLELARIETYFNLAYWIASLPGGEVHATLFGVV